MSIEIREANKRDLDKIVNMWSDLAFDHQQMMKGYELNENAREEWREFVEKGLEKKAMNTFVAEENQKLVGFLNVVIRERMDIFENKFMGMILDVFVKPDWRGKGVGSLLTEEAEKWIKNKGVKTAVLTVSPENKKGVEFWEGKGYETYLLKKRKELF